MVDFLMIATRSSKKGTIEIYPKFIVKKSSDLMIRGGDFYAIWIEERGLWSTDEQDALQLIDNELDKYAKENSKHFDSGLVKILHMWDSESGMIDRWHKYCQKQMRDSFHMLDEKIIFSNMDVKKNDYASKKLDYPLEKATVQIYFCHFRCRFRGTEAVIFPCFPHHIFQCFLVCFLVRSENNLFTHFHCVPFLFSLKLF